ncbi:MAG: TolC family protein [bacterium]
MRDGCTGLGLAWALAACLAGGLLGCTPRYYRADADREVYGVVAAKQRRVLGADRPFTIEPALGDPLEGLRRGEEAAAPRAARGFARYSQDDLDKIPEDGVPRQEGAVVLSLADALALAAEHSRDYQARKEQLYASALDLTLERHLWRPQWLGTLFAGGTAGAVDSGSAGSSFSMSQLLALGGEVSVSVANDFVKYWSGGLDHSATTALAVDVIQPLWRDAGRLVAQENLTQSERDMVYAVRSFARFRKTFCVQVTSSYYGVLRSRDAVTNQWRNYQRVRQSVERTQWLAAKGDLPPFQVDQARQDQLAAWDSWLQAVRRYQEQLDRFKVDLALPADAAVELDPQEVERLREKGLRELPLTLDRAVRIALRRRFDLMNTVAEVADAERKVIIAANGLAPDLDLTASASVDSAARKPLRLETSQGRYSAGLEAGLPLNRKAERNAYRRSLITLEASRRDADEQRDQVVLDVRDAWRTLEDTAARYRTQEESLKLADRRVESTSALLEAGRAQTRDLLEALRAQLNAQNALTATLIDNILARLALWRDTELLRVDEDGVWKEVTDVPE